MHCLYMYNITPVFDVIVVIHVFMRRRERVGISYDRLDQYLLS